MSNHLSVLFDRKPRHSKSASNLDISTQSPYQGTQQQSQKPKITRPRDNLTVMHEYNFGRPLPLLPKQQPQQKIPNRATRSADVIPRHNTQIRAGTAPTLHPPDELYLQTIRRRSASAVLEDTHRWPRDDQADQDIASRLAFASALPPSFFESPPEYTAYSVNAGEKSGSLHRSQKSGAGQSKSRSKTAHDELFLTIDETIASFQLTMATPVESPQHFASVVSPMNDIDRLYLERRQRKQKAKR